MRRWYASMLGVAFILAGAVLAFIIIIPIHSRAATACTSTSGCSSPDICYFPDTDQSYCALPVGGSSSCSFGCCSKTDCGPGQTCFNAGTVFAYCALPAASTGSSSNTNTSGSTSAGTTGTTSNTGTNSSASNNTAGSATGSSCKYACCGNAGYQGQGGCQLNEANNDTVCYYPGTPAAYCGNPLGSGQTPSTGCAFPTSTYNAAGWSEIDAQCADTFAADVAKCTAANDCSPSSYGSNESEAELCSEPGATPGIGYCIGGETPQANGCENAPSEAVVAAAVGASCSGPTVPTGNTGSAGSGSTPGGPETSFQSVQNGGATTDNQGLHNLYSNGGAGSAVSTGPTGSAGTTGANTNANTNTTFPVTVLVTVPSLNVRSAPNTTASLAGSQTLFAGDTFMATNEVQGENVDEDGVTSDLWWVSSLGNYVWSGGTEVIGSGSTGGLGSGTGLKGSSPTTEAQTTNTNPSISSAAYSPSTGLLFIDGIFDGSGNTVSVNGTQLSNNGADQTASLLQIPIEQSINGSAYNAVMSGSYIITVRDSQGTATFTVSPAVVPVLNSVQGYNPATNVYESSTNVLNQGDTYIILYGTFPASGNGVTLGFGNTAATVPPSQITFQSASQINVSLGSLLPAGIISFTVIAYDTGGGGSQPVTVTVHGVSSVMPASISDAQLTTELTSAIEAGDSLSTMTSIATQDGFLVYVSADGQTALVRDPVTNDVVVSLSETDD